MFCLQILVKKYHLPLIKKFHGYLGGSKKIIHTPHQNILQGNGVVYRNFTFNSLLLQVFTSYLYIILLCRYCKRTDIYYSTWSFENVAKIASFSF